MAFAYKVHELAAVPWMVRRIAISSTDTTAEALVHGGPAVIPDIVIPVLTIANPTASEISITAKSTTTVTVDAEGASDTADIYCIWFAASEGGGIGS